MMNDQETFNTVVEHMINQGEPAMDGHGSCKYRAYKEDGTVLKCAVGALIRDENYSYKLESLSASHDDVKEALKDNYNSDLLLQLQAAHDNWDYNDGYFKASLELIAGDFSLEVPDILRSWAV